MCDLWWTSGVKELNKYRREREWSLYKKWSFSLRVSSVNLTKSAVYCIFCTVGNIDMLAYNYLNHTMMSVETARRCTMEEIKLQFYFQVKSNFLCIKKLCITLSWNSQNIKFATHCMLRSQILSGQESVGLIW